MAMLPDLTAATYPQYSSRLMAITPETPAAWGKLNATTVMLHLEIAFRMSLGEVPEARKALFPSPVQAFMWLMVFHWWTTWPKGKIKAPDYFTPPAEASLDEHRQRLFAVMDRFVEARENTPERREMSPLAGRLSMKQWSHLHAVHTSHHFRQFGVL